MPGSSGQDDLLRHHGDFSPYENLLTGCYLCNDVKKHLPAELLPANPLRAAEPNLEVATGRLYPCEERFS